LGGGVVTDCRTVRDKSFYKQQLFGGHVRKSSDCAVTLCISISYSPVDIAQQQ
jgi:hypothetical protein